MLGSDILSILNGLKDDSYVSSVVYQSPSRTNVDLDGTAHPVAILFLFRDGAVDLSTGLFREVAEVNVLFVTHQTQLDFSGSANDLLMDAMVMTAQEFVARLMESSSVEIVGDEIGVRGLYDYDDKNTTGVSLTFRCREVAGHCLTPHYPEPEPEPDPDPENDNSDEDNQTDTD